MSTTTVNPSTTASPSTTANPSTTASPSTTSTTTTTTTVTPSTDCNSLREELGKLQGQARDAFKKMQSINQKITNKNIRAQQLKDKYSPYAGINLDNQATAQAAINVTNTILNNSIQKNNEEINNILNGPFGTFLTAFSSDPKKLIDAIIEGNSMSVNKDYVPPKNIPAGFLDTVTGNTSFQVLLELTVQNNQLNQQLVPNYQAVKGAREAYLNPLTGFNAVKGEINSLKAEMNSEENKLYGNGDGKNPSPDSIYGKINSTQDKLNTECSNNNADAGRKCSSLVPNCYNSQEDYHNAVVNAAVACDKGRTSAAAFYCSFGVSNCPQPTWTCQATSGGIMCI